MSANYRAEVGLLTHNIVFSSSNKKGLHLTFKGTKDKGLSINMESVEL
jgi:hypothetical protein